MSIKKNITFSKLSAVTISAVGLLSALISIYAFFVQEKKISLQYEIISNSNVLDINAEISKLDILYNGSSLKQKNENLRVINLKVINSGSEHILSTFYDDNNPLGFTVSDGSIIENPEILDASNKYLKDNLRVGVDSTGKVTFSKAIVESNESFILKVLILHKSTIEPIIVPVGKIAGIKNILMGRY